MKKALIFFVLFFAAATAQAQDPLNFNQFVIDRDPASAPLVGSELVPVIQNTATHKTTAQDIANLASGATPRPVCSTVELPTDADDNVPIYPAPAALTITGVGCRITGTALTLDFEDADANTVRASVPCDTGNSITYVTGGLTNTTFTSGEFMQFDVNGAPTTPGWATICVTYTLN